MYLDCPICLNSFKFEDIRSLPCGHTYCWACVERILDDDDDDDSTCPECRQAFDLDDVKRLFIKPSACNNSSGSQTNPSRHDATAEEEGFIRQAKHIATRLRKINAKSPAQSVRHAADVIEHVATVQCKEAQEIVWDAVREFWLRLVDYFEQLELWNSLRDEVSSLDQRLKALDETVSRLQLQVEREYARAEEYLVTLEDKLQEVERLKAALHDANDETKREQERHHVVVARFRASEIKHRAQIKQLKKELRSREAAASTSRLQMEEESLIIDPGVAYDESRSHRLEVYNENSPRSNRHESPPEEESLHADNFYHPSSANDFPDRLPLKDPRSPSEPQTHPGGPTGQSHHQTTTQPESDLVPPSPQRPRFRSDWNLSNQGPQRRKMTAKSSNSATFPFPLNPRGRPKGLLKYGSRVRMKAR